MNLLFNLVAVQPIHSAKFHGGGSYGEVIFWALVKRGARFSCAYDSRKYLDPAILDACKQKGIPLFDISVQTPQEIIDANQIDTFYTPLYSLEKKWAIDVKDFVFTWHGVRALEMQYSWAGVGFAKKLGQKLEALVRYRESWKKGVLAAGSCREKVLLAHERSPLGKEQPACRPCVRRTGGHV